MEGTIDKSGDSAMDKNEGKLQLLVDAPLLSDVDEKFWIDARVRIEGGRLAGREAVVTSHKLGWIRVDVEGITDVVKKRANELRLLSTEGLPPEAALGQGRSRASSTASHRDASTTASGTKDPVGDEAEAEGRDEGSEASDDDGTSTAERALIGETVKVVTGEQAGKVGFVIRRNPDGSFVVKAGEEELTLRRDQFRKTSSAAALAAALGSSMLEGADSGLDMRASRRLRTTTTATTPTQPKSTLPANPPTKRKARTINSDRAKPAKRARKAVEETETGSRSSSSSPSSVSASEASSDSSGDEKPVAEKPAKRRRKPPRMNADKVMAQELKNLLGADIPSALDSLGLSEADKEALVEGMTPRRSTRAVKIVKPIATASTAQTPVGDAEMPPSAPASPREDIDDSTGEGSARVRGGARKEEKDVEEDAAAREDVEDQADTPAHTSSSKLAKSRKSRGGGGAKSRAKVVVEEPVVSQQEETPLQEPVDVVQPTSIATSKRPRAAAMSAAAMTAAVFNDRAAEEDALLAAEEVAPAAKRPKKHQKGVKFGVPADETIEREVREVKEEAPLPVPAPPRRKKTTMSLDKPMRGVGWEYVPVTETGTTAAVGAGGSTMSVSGAHYYTVPLHERVRAYVQRIQEKHIREKRAKLQQFVDRMDLPVPGDPFFAEHRDWTKMDNGASAVSLPLQPSPTAELLGKEVGSGKTSNKQPSIADHIIGAGKEAKEAKEADTAGKVLRYFKIGASRLSKVVDISLGYPVNDSSSDESSDEEYVQHALGGGPVIHERKAMEAAAKVGKAYVPPPCVEISDHLPYIHSWNYKYDAGLDKHAAAGSHRRPPFFGVRGITAYISQHEDKLVYPRAASSPTEGTPEKDSSPVEADVDVNGVEPTVITRAALLTKPPSDANSLYVYDRCPYCYVVKEDRQSYCWNLACVCCPLHPAYKPHVKEAPLPQAPQQPEGLFDPRALEPPRAAAVYHTRHAEEYSRVGITIAKPSAEENEVLHVVDPVHAVKVPSAALFKQEEPAAAICKVATDAFTTVSQDIGKSQGTADTVEGVYAKEVRARAAVDLYYDLVFDTTSRRVFSGRPLRTRTLTGRKRLPDTSIWGTHLREIEHERDEHSAPINSNGKQGEHGDQTPDKAADLNADSSAEDDSSATPLPRTYAVPSIGLSPVQHGWVKRALAEQQDNEGEHGERRDHIHQKSTSQTRNNSNKHKRPRPKPKKPKRKEGGASRQRVVYENGWTYVIDQEEEEAEESRREGAQEAPMNAEEAFARYAGPVLHKDPDYESNAYKELERERGFDAYYADSDPYLAAFTRVPPDIYPADPLQHENIYSVPEPTGAKLGNDVAADDLLPACEVAKEMETQNAMQYAAATEAILLSDYQVDAPVRFLGAASHPRMLRCGDAGNELTLRYSLGQAEDEYIYTKAAQLVYPGDKMHRLGYPTVGTTDPGAGGALPYALDGLLYRYSSWRRDVAEEHPDLEASVTLMQCAVSQLPVEEHRALSRETCEIVAEVVKQNNVQNGIADAGSSPKAATQISIERESDEAADQAGQSSDVLVKSEDERHELSEGGVTASAEMEGTALASAIAAQEEAAEGQSIGESHAQEEGASSLGDDDFAAEAGAQAMADLADMLLQHSDTQPQQSTANPSKEQEQQQQRQEENAPDCDGDALDAASAMDSLRGEAAQ